MKYLFIVLLQIPIYAWSQSGISLESCINWAYQHFEYEKQAIAYRESAELADENATKNWYPQLILDGNASYQNENISIPIVVPGFDAPAVPLNFNRLLVKFNQTIYDGSMTASKRMLEQSKYSILEKSIETEKLKVKSKVIGMYTMVALS